MALVRWDPATTVPTLQNRVNRLFEDMFPETREDLGLMEWRPSVDTYEKDDAIVVKAELPGVKKEDVDIDISNNVLTINGERHYDDVKNEDYYRRERFHGKFQRAFTLPDNVDMSNIDASFKDGVIEVTVPKTEKTQTQKIEIK